MTSTARALSYHPASGFFARAAEVAPIAEPVTERGHASLAIEGKNVRIGGRQVDAGVYRVRVDESRERVVLESDARTYALTAFFRRAREAAHAPVEAFLEGADTGHCFVVVRLANGGEWIA